MSVGQWSAVHSPYSEDEVKKYAPATAGDYFVWIKYKEAGWRPEYVGKADDIRGRLLDHLRDDEKNNCLKENRRYPRAFVWIPITTEAERMGAEKLIYDAQKPECNQIDPGGEPLRIPPPPKPTV